MTSNQPSPNPLSRWLDQRQTRLLEDSYRAAQDIRILEEKYFQGDRIAPTANQSKTIFEYVKSLRDRQLFKIRVNLAQFQVGEFFLDRKAVDLADPRSELTNSQQQAEVIGKLDFIDSVVEKYRDGEDDFDPMTAISPTTPMPKSGIEPGLTSTQDVDARVIDPAVTAASSSRSGFFGLRQELTPEYEQQVIQELRLRRQQDKTAIRWLIILIAIPILVQVLARNLVFEPFLGHVADSNPEIVELSKEIREGLFKDFNESREELEVEELLGLTPQLSFEERKQRLQETAVELWREGEEEELNGLKNFLADGIGILAFAGLVYFNPNKVTAVRRFFNRTFLSLNDPTKVFLFILLTDMFVGFHSAEGWDVLLGGIANHFGLPENQAAINTFIATVPVILDSCIKFWIFNYLTRYSPATSAIYERMNT